MKRIRKYPDSPNPLFEKWLEEWKKEAIVRQLPIQDLFGKALESLRKYPLPLATGRDCYILQNFGSKLCIMLDKKLKWFNKLHNTASASNQNCLTSNNGMKNQGEIFKNKSHELIKQKKTPNKTYIPKIGSASYAILIIMYKNKKLPNNSDFMYKKDIIFQAQCEYNCSMQSKKSERYSGWSCMSLLIKKNLVIKKSNPAKYSLTDTGVCLAKSLLEAKERLSLDFSDEDIQLDNNLKNIQNSNSVFTSSTSTITKSKSPCTVFYNLKHLKNTSKTYDINIITIDDDDNDLVNNDNDKKLIMDEFNDGKISNIKKLSRKEFNTKNIEFNDSFHKFCKENARSLLTEVEKEFNINRKQIEKKEKIKRKIADDTTIADQNKMIMLTETIESFYLLPNNFDIILIVDIQETSGYCRKKTDSNPKLSELRKIGILFEVRSLKIGDFAWIARCRFTNRELILPYIVERKRMDDFSSSIKDGRYHEQKFRLKQSGISNIIYMIENYGSYHGSIPISSLLQAATNSLVQDDFTIKFTDDHKSSMRYLSTMTKTLTEIFETKELKSCKKQDLPSTKPNISEGEQLLMEFAEFNKAAMKIKNFTVQEMLIRQLVQLKGLSIEKALAIVQRYPTPKCLSEALQNEGENLLTNIIVESSKRKIGPSISKILHQFYTTLNFN